ncbi:MAG: hypothetical protein HY657_15255 [Acidobacteria bacterium]|nr:hypothetical protein [Acidobacteriota bacterium]
MPQRLVFTLTAVGLLAQPAAIAQTGPTPAPLEANKRVVMEFYRPGITPDERYALIHKDYLQHNAAYVKYAKERNISGNEAFRQIRLAQAEAIAAGRATPPGQAAPGAPQGNTFHVLYAEGDLVVRIAQRWPADPTRTGQFYETFTWDTFRVRNAKLVEHWDGATLQAPARGRGSN